VSSTAKAGRERGIAPLSLFCSALSYLKKPDEYLLLERSTACWAKEPEITKALFEGLHELGNIYKGLLLQRIGTCSKASEIECGAMRAEFKLLESCEYRLVIMNCEELKLLLVVCCFA